MATLTFSESTPIGWWRPGPLSAAPESMRSTAAHARRTTGRRPRPSLPITRIVGRSAVTPRQVCASASPPAPLDRRRSSQFMHCMHAHAPSSAKQTERMQSLTAAVRAQQAFEYALEKDISARQTHQHTSGTRLRLKVVPISFQETSERLGKPETTNKMPAARKSLS